MSPDQEAEYREYVTLRAHRLRGYAYVCCGDWHLAEDAVQNALVRLYGAWGRAKRENLDAYTRRIITNALIDEKRRAWWRRERLSDTVPDTPAPAEQDGGAERLTLHDAVMRLPPRQRAAVVLRFIEDQSIEQTAHQLGCSVHAVKSLSARGLTTLRALLGDRIALTPQGSTT